jgi:hypothetical protein
MMRAPFEIVGRAVTVLGLAWIAASSTPALAQQSANFSLTESSFTVGGMPLSSPSFQVTLDSAGLGLIGEGVSGPSFGMDGGFVASFAPAGEVLGVRFTSSTTLIWEADPSTGDYNIYRGPLKPFDSAYGMCRLAGLASTSAMDSDPLAVGQGFFYLVTARNRLAEEGTKGFSSLDMERLNAVPCP